MRVILAQSRVFAPACQRTGGVRTQPAGRRYSGGGRQEQLGLQPAQEDGAESGIPSDLIANGRELEPDWVTGVHTVGIAARASPAEVTILPGREETIEFRTSA